MPGKAREGCERWPGERDAPRAAAPAAPLPDGGFAAQSGRTGGASGLGVCGTRVCCRVWVPIWFPDAVEKLKQTPGAVAVGARSECVSAARRRIWRFPEHLEKVRSPGARRYRPRESTLAEPPRVGCAASSLRGAASSSWASFCVFPNGGVGGRWPAWNPLVCLARRVLDCGRSGCTEVGSGRGPRGLGRASIWTDFRNANVHCLKCYSSPSAAAFAMRRNRSPSETNVFMCERLCSSGRRLFH